MRGRSSSTARRRTTRAGPARHRTSAIRRGDQPKESEMSGYDERPWLALYGPGIPREIEPEHENMLAAFGDAAARNPDAIAIRYFDHPITYLELEALTD